MKVLVAGHQGHIVAGVGPLLRAAGHEVTGLDTDLYEGCDFGEDSVLISSAQGFGFLHGRKHALNNDFGMSSFIASDLFPRMTFQGLSANPAPSEAKGKSK